MRTYGQYCPMAKAVEILGDRWTLLILRDLLLGIRHFNELERGLPGISRALLAERLRRLERTGVVQRRVLGGRATEYQLTAAGRALQEVVDVLVRWGTRWAFGEPDPDDLDPVLLAWWMRGRVHHDRLPLRQNVVQFDFRGARTQTVWLVLNCSDVSVCLQHPGFDIDLTVTADIATFFRVWLGACTLAEAMRAGLVEIDGLPALVRAFPTWWAWSPVASVVRATLAAAMAPEHDPDRVGIPVTEMR